MAINCKNLLLQNQKAMILKLGMKHQGGELYNVYINHDPGMTLTYLKSRSPMHLNGENCQNVI